jgi:hypothetical protein
MPITSIKRDWGAGLAILRIVSNDVSGTVFASGYLAAQKPVINLINNGNFDFSGTDYVLVVYSTGWSFASLSSDYSTLIQTPSGTGTVNSGTENQLGFYEANGTTISGLTLGTNLSITSNVLNAMGGGGGNISGSGTNGSITYFTGTETVTGVGDYIVDGMGGMGISGDFTTYGNISVPNGDISAPNGTLTVSTANINSLLSSVLRSEFGTDFIILPSCTYLNQSKVRVTPSNGATINLANFNYLTIVDPASSLTTLVFVFPASPQNGQKQIVSFTQIITSINWNGNGNGVQGMISAATVGQIFSATFNADTGTWYPG